MPGVQMLAIRTKKHQDKLDGMSKGLDRDAFQRATDQMQHHFRSFHTLKALSADDKVELNRVLQRGNIEGGAEQVDVRAATSTFETGMRVGVFHKSAKGIGARWCLRVVVDWGNAKKAHEATKTPAGGRLYRAIQAVRDAKGIVNHFVQEYPGSFVAPADDVKQFATEYEDHLPFDVEEDRCVSKFANLFVSKEEDLDDGLTREQVRAAFMPGQRQRGGGAATAPDQQVPTTTTTRAASARQQLSAGSLHNVADTGDAADADGVPDAGGPTPLAVADLRAFMTARRHGAQLGSLDASAGDATCRAQTSFSRFAEARAPLRTLYDHLALDSLDPDGPTAAEMPNHFLRTAVPRLLGDHVEQGPLEVFCAAACYDAHTDGTLSLFGSGVLTENHSEGQIPPSAPCAIITQPRGKHSWGLYLLPGDGTVWLLDPAGDALAPADHSQLEKLLMWTPPPIGRITIDAPPGPDGGLAIATAVLRITGDGHPAIVDGTSLLRYCSAFAANLPLPRSFGAHRSQLPTVWNPVFDTIRAASGAPTLDAFPAVVETPDLAAFLDSRAVADGLAAIRAKQSTPSGCPVAGCVAGTCGAAACPVWSRFRVLRDAFGADATLRRRLVNEPARSRDVLGDVAQSPLAHAAASVRPGTYVDQSVLDVLCAAACANPHGQRDLCFLAADALADGLRDCIPPNARCAIIAHPRERHWALYLLPGDGSAWYLDSLFGPGQPQDHSALTRCLAWRVGGVGHIRCARQSSCDCALHVASNVLNAARVLPAPPMAEPRVTRASLAGYVAAVCERLPLALTGDGWDVVWDVTRAVALDAGSDSRPVGVGDAVNATPLRGDGAGVDLPKSPVAESQLAAPLATNATANEAAGTSVASAALSSTARAASAAHQPEPLGEDEADASEKPQKRGPMSEEDGGSVLRHWSQSRSNLPGVSASKEAASQPGNRVGQREGDSAHASPLPGDGARRVTSTTTSAGAAARVVPNAAMTAGATANAAASTRRSPAPAAPVPMSRAGTSTRRDGSTRAHEKRTRSPSAVPPAQSTGSKQRMGRQGSLVLQP